MYKELINDLKMVLQSVLIKLHDKDPVFIKLVASLLKQLDKLSQEDTNERN